MKEKVRLSLFALCASPTFIEGATAFNFSNPTVTGGTNPFLSAGTILTYSQADPGNLYDVVVSVTAVANPLATASPTTFTSPQVVDGAGATSGLFLTRWDWNDDALEYTDAQLFMTFDFEVYDTGTRTLASDITLIASSFDNDGSDLATAAVNEFVIYSSGADFTSVGVTQTTLPQADGRTAFLGPNVVEPGVTDDPDYLVEANYENQSTFTWTSGHLVDGRTPDANPGAARLGALQLSFEPIPEPSTSLLTCFAGLSFLARRRRA